MEITKKLAALLRAALKIVDTYPSHHQDLRALLIRGNTISAASEHLSLHLALKAPLAPDLPDTAFRLDCGTVKAALAIDRKVLNVVNGDYGKLCVNGISVSLDTATRHVDVCRELTSRLAPNGALPAYEEAQLAPPFWTNLDRVRPAMAERDIRQYFNGLLMDFANRRIVACDGYRMHIANGNTLPVAAPLSKDEHGAPKASPAMVLRREAVEIIRSLKPRSVSTWLPDSRPDGNGHDGLFVFRGEDEAVRWQLTATGMNGIAFADLDRAIPPPYATRRKIALEKWATEPGASGVPAQVVIPDYSRDLEAFNKAGKAAIASRHVPAVILDLRSGRLRNFRDNPVAFDKEVFKVDDGDGWQRPQEPSHSECRINASFLAEGLKALGQKRATWDIDPRAIWRATDDADLTVIITGLHA